MTAQPTPEHLPVWANRAQEYLKFIDDEIAAWRDEASHRMVRAVVDGKGWAGNQDVEYAVARVSNLMMMRVIADGVSDAFVYRDMMNGTGGDQPIK